MAVQAGCSRGVEGLFGDHWGGSHMARFAVILFVADQAAITIPGGHLSMAPTAEEVCVVSRHLALMAGLAGLLTVAQQAGFFVKGTDFAMRMRPFRTQMGLRFGLLMAGLALVLCVAVEAHAFIDPLGFLAMGLPEVGAAMPVRRVLAADLCMAEGAIVRIPSGLADFGKQSSVGSADIIGHLFAGSSILVAAGALG